MRSYEKFVSESACPKRTATILLAPVSLKYTKLLLKTSANLSRVATSVGSVGLLSGIALTLSAGRGVAGWYVLLVFISWLGRRAASPLAVVLSAILCFSLFFVHNWTVGDLISIVAIAAAGLYGAELPSAAL